MTPEQLALVRRTAALVEQAGDDFALAFYEHLVELHPSARRFLSDDPGAQSEQLVDGVVFFATAVDHPEFFERAHELGELLQAFGVRAADYEVFGEALVAAVAGIVGHGWTLGMASAWRRLYALIAEAMLEGAATHLFMKPG
jgi:hemoglobin-like flavoprotein